MGIDSARATRLAALLRAERASLGSVLAEAAAAAGIEAPAGLVLRGAGDVVHDLYTGTERIMERVADEFDGGPPGGAAWHRELLRSMALDLPGNRPPLFRVTTAQALDEYLRFRLLYRNTYGFELQWTRLQPLLERAEATWTLVHADVSSFLAFLDALASTAPVPSSPAE